MKSISQKCQSKKSICSCKSKKKDSKHHTLATLVNCYLEECQNCYQEEDKWWADKNISWSEAVERAWRSIMENGKMHGHQCNVGKKKLEEGLTICKSNQRKSDSFNDFHDVYCWIESITKKTEGIGSLTIYDVARRLGAWLELEPSKVYLHRGALKGARKLHIKGEIVSLNDFPPEIQKLGATHAENFLCICKDEIAKLVSD